jgi:hypothetical protein
MSNWDDDDMEQMFVNTPHNTVITAYLQENPDAQTTMTDLTDRGRASKAVPADIPAGSRVAFITNLGSVMLYPNPPERGSVGTVVKVRTSSGDSTCHNDFVFVKWDDGHFLPTHREHLRLSAEKLSHRYRKGFTTRTYDRFIVAGLGVLGDEFFVSASSGTDLVHKATKDLWSVSKGDEGYVIERLFDDTGEPLKV